ncbi:sensor histidine kinase [Aquabacterium sp.]|uniref:sensor histidine kinase n=1 Tax=Aquabacterium sp. TaxID=1872578 RepID=UPI002B51A97A|nr:response regulator [Aquabacterium sp.]HSW05476.1 response regulator [Aquabacterium sp.]
MATSAASDTEEAARSILIVDDVSANLQVITGQLEARGYVVLVARSGQEAIERVAFAHPDLILLDVVMPGMDGFETCRRLKQNEASCDIPVIFMTALTATDDKIEGFRVGAVDYVTKPLNTEEVVARVTTHLALCALRRQLAAQNRQLREEIASRGQLHAALQRSNAQLEQLAYVASHDMQEPLRMVASYLQLVAQRYGSRLDADGLEFIGYAVDGAKRMQALINDLLAFSRLSTKTRPFEPIAIAQIVATAEFQLQMAIKDSGASITKGELPTVLGDSTQLLQLFQNLVGNAIKFRGDAAPRVHVAAQASEEGWLFSVSDNGIGIAPAYFEHIFVLFKRLHGRKDYAGTGIGLALCKSIVEGHGGRIWVESSPGRGSIFRFTLPRVKAPT